MKPSSFIVTQQGTVPGSKLLYSTLTTSMVELDNSIYNDVFLNHRFELYPNETAALTRMGFLLDDDFDELRFLEHLREKTVRNNVSSPSYYIICPTTGCNARCYYCFEHGAMQRRMEDATAERVADYIIKHHDEDHLVIQWFGGEPLLAPETISLIVDRLHSNDVSFISKIITNGYLLSDDIIDRASRSWNVKIVQITIDALHEQYNEIKNYINPRSDPFETVMRNIERGLAAGLKIRIRVNFDPRDTESAIATVDYLKQRFGGSDTFYVYFAPIDSTDIPSISSQFEKAEKHPLIELLDAEQAYCSFGNYEPETGTPNEYEMILRKYYLTPIPISCYGGCQSSLTIDSLGNIYDCHRLLGHEDYSSGNVFTGRVNNEVSHYYSNTKITEERCLSCNLLPLCQGGCKFRAFQYGADRACTSIKGAVKELVLRAYGEISALRA